MSASVDDLLLAALEQGNESLETGRYVITYRDGAVDEGLRSLKTQGFRVADARDFRDQAVAIEEVGDAEALVFPEIRSTIVGGAALRAHGLSTQEEIAAEGPVEAIEPEYFAFGQSQQYARGFARSAETIAEDLGAERGVVMAEEEEINVKVLGATWGLVRCRVPPSVRSGLGIKVAVLDTGMTFSHPDFAGRSITVQTFVGQPVEDLQGHGTFCIGIACGPKAPPGITPRYGIAFASRVFVGKVLTNSGTGSSAGVLAGMNWAVANGCQVILVPLGSQTPPQAAYTAAGLAALRRGCLMIAPAGSSGSSVGAPANSPTIMSVASLDRSLTPSSFSNYGKVDIAAPGVDVFSCAPMPRRYVTWSGTSGAASHVAGCAALWAQSSPVLRGTNLCRRLQSSALRLPFPPSRVGSGLVQAP